MANYSLVINSQFHPISYQEMIDPVVRTQQAQDALEDRYSELQANANIWNGYVDEQRDKRAYAQLHNYSSQLRQASDALYKSGMNASSKRTLMNLLGRYSSEIKPIENAYKARAEEIKEQRAGELSGVMYETDANTKSLDDYLANPEGRSKQASYKESYTRIASAMKNLKNQLSGYGLGKPIDHYTNTFLKSHGITPQNAAAAIGAVRDVLSGKQNDWGNNILTDLFKGEMDAQGVSGWADKNKQMQFFNKIAPAVYEGIGAQDVTPITNQAAMQAAQDARLRYRLNHQGGNGSANVLLDGRRPIPIGKPRNIYETNKLSPKANSFVGRKQGNGYNGAKQFFYTQNGVPKITFHGKQIIKDKYDNFLKVAQKANEGSTDAQKNIKQFIKEHPSEANLFNFLMENHISSREARNGIGEGVTSAFNKAYGEYGDLVKHSEVMLALDHSGLEQIKGAMGSLQGEHEEIPTIKIQQKKGGGLEYRQTSTKTKDLSGYEISSASTVIPRTQGAPPYYEVIYKNKDGKQKVVNVPISQINSTADEWAKSNMANVQYLSNILNEMNKHKTNELTNNGVHYTRRNVEDAIIAYRNGALQSGEAGFATSTNKPMIQDFDIFPQEPSLPTSKRVPKNTISEDEYWNNYSGEDNDEE